MGSLIRKITYLLYLFEDESGGHQGLQDIYRSTYFRVTPTATIKPHVSFSEAIQYNLLNRTLTGFPAAFHQIRSIIFFWRVCLADSKPCSVKTVFRASRGVLPSE